MSDKAFKEYSVGVKEEGEKMVFVFPTIDQIIDTREAYVKFPLLNKDGTPVDKEYKMSLYEFMDLTISLGGRVFFIPNKK